ncbi:MAG TPA: ATP-binding protein [Thermoanaerobaculia bacterium]|nr:ATP-binding protein [Thermoanaerobaculia bacterium]
MTRLRTFRLAFSLTLALLVVALGGVSVYRKVQTFQTLGFEAIPQAGVTSVESVQIPSLGLKAGDQILLINGSKAQTRDQLVELLRERPQSELTLMRGEQLFRLQYHRPPLETDFPYLVFCLVAVFYLAIGLYTLLRQRDGQGFLFYLWCLTSAALYLLTPAPATGIARTLIYLGDEIARLLLPALTLHLFLVFPAPVPAAGTAGRLRRFIPFFYLPAAVMIALQLDMLLNHGHMVFGKVDPARLALLDRIELAHFAVLVVAAIAVLFWRVRRGAAWEQHRQMQWMAWGVTGGYLPFLLLCLVPLALRLTPSQLVTSAAVLPLGLVPLTFAYAVLRYKLWDIEVIVRDTISLTLTLLLGIIGFSLVNLAIDRGVSQELSLARNLLSFLSGLGIAGLLLPTRGAISSALERIHYRDTFGKRKALTGLGRELLLERDLGRLCAALLDRIQEAVDVEAANLYLLQGDALAAIRQEPALPDRLPPDLLGEDFWGKEVERLSGVTLPAEPLPLPARLFVAGYRYAFPLTVRARGIGIVLAGFKRDHMPLNSEDTDLIRHLLNQASLAIENAQLVGQLQLQLEEVRQLQRYTEGIFESSPAGIAVLDGERRLVSANSAFAGIVGRSRDSLTGLGLESLLPVQPLPTPGEGPVEARWTDPEGRERHLQLSLAAFERGWRQGLNVLVVHDVSERVAMENALREKDRLAALGMLAAGVAHEVNTPITGISSYAQMLLEETEPSDPHYDILKKVERQTFRASRIVNNLLELARNRQKERKATAVAPLICECLDLFSDRLGKRGIELKWTPPHGAIQVMACDGELQQVFTNLILNALDAMNDTGGRLTLDVMASDSQVMVRVEDSGPGIPADKLETIFQPFYSTKLSRGGTGLGLSISSEIVRRHGGDLRVVSRPGEGACFLVELPRHQPAAAPV